jgi:hypothetical protein
MGKRDMLEQIINYYSGGNKSKFANMIGVKPQTINTWLLRGTFDIELIYSKCENLSGDWLLSGEGDMLRAAPTAIANGDSSVAVNNNTGNIYSSECDALKDRIILLERIIEEKERTIKILMKGV